MSKGYPNNKDALLMVIRNAFRGKFIYIHSHTGMFS